MRKRRGILLLGSLLSCSLLSFAQALYDAEGNLVKDPGRGIDTILYNSIHLLQEIQVAGKGKLEYQYDASGRRLWKTVTDAANNRSTHYYDEGLEYDNQQALQEVSNEEGRVLPGITSWRYEYSLKDHLGNSRVAFEADPASGQPRVLQATAYYPFGGIQGDIRYTNSFISKYLYNGKEIQDELSLGWYDYGARMYDPILGRWHSIDPLAEKFLSISPYTYVLNSPIKMIDPDGRQAIEFPVFIKPTNETGELRPYQPVEEKSATLKEFVPPPVRELKIYIPKSNEEEGEQTPQPPMILREYKEDLVSDRMVSDFQLWLAGAGASPIPASALADGANVVISLLMGDKEGAAMDVLAMGVFGIPAWRLSKEGMLHYGNLERRYIKERTGLAKKFMEENPDVFKQWLKGRSDKDFSRKSRKALEAYEETQKALYKKYEGEVEKGLPEWVDRSRK